MPLAAVDRKWQYEGSTRPNAGPCGLFWFKRTETAEELAESSVQPHEILRMIRGVELARGSKKNSAATGMLSRRRLQIHAVVVGKAPDILAAEKEILAGRDLLRQRMGNPRSGLCESRRAHHLARPGDACERKAARRRCRLRRPC